MPRQNKNRVQQAVEAAKKTSRLPGRGPSSQLKAAVRKLRNQSSPPPRR